jgi:RimJ/RimL family protein N-acetyltransferase
MATLEVVSPFPTYAVPRLWGWIQEFHHRVCDDFAVKTVEGYVTEWETALQRGRQSWAVYRDGELGGAITATRLSPMLADIHTVFAKRFWGHATTLVALRQVCEGLFAEGATKIVSLAYKDNRSVIGIWRALGGTIEGTLEAQTMRAGKPADMIVLGLSKERFDAASSTPVGRKPSRQAMAAEGPEEAGAEPVLAAEAPPLKSAQELSDGQLG